jgi:hypothetical protein
MAVNRVEFERLPDQTAKGRNGYFTPHVALIITLPAYKDTANGGLEKIGHNVHVGIQSARVPDNDPLVIQLAPSEMRKLANALLTVCDQAETEKL